MTNGVHNIGLDVHGITRIEIRQRGRGFSKWLNICLFGEDGSSLEVTAFCSAGFPTIEQFDLPNGDVVSVSVETTT